MSSRYYTVSNVDTKNLGDEFSSQRESLGLQADVKAKHMIAAEICA